LAFNNSQTNNLNGMTTATFFSPVTAFHNNSTTNMANMAPLFNNQPTTESPASKRSKNKKAKSPTNSQSRSNKNKDDNNNNGGVSPHSKLACSYIQKEQYVEAILCYEQALEDYIGQLPLNQNQHPNRPTIVEFCNAAATCFNLGALHKKVHQYERSLAYLTQSHDLYRKCVELVETTSTMQAPSSRTTSPKPKRTNSNTRNTSNISVCLLQLMAETLTTKGNLQSKCLDHMDAAIDCHEEVVALLDTILETPGNIGTGNGILPEPPRREIGSITFLPLGDFPRMELLCVSLQQLGKLYAVRGDTQDGIQAYQEAVLLLRRLDQLQLEGGGGSRHRKAELARVLRTLSELYLSTQEMDSAVEALSEAMDIITSQDEQQQQEQQIENPPNSLILAMEQMGRANEQLQNWDKALNCYERILLLQSQHYGPEHLRVAVSLQHVGRVLVCQGNPDGGLDLLHAALKIYMQHESIPQGLVLTMATLYMNQGQPSDAVQVLVSSLKYLTTQEDDNDDQGEIYHDYENDHENSNEEEEPKSVAQVYRELGRAYMELKEYTKSRQCLVKSARLLEETSQEDDQVLTLLQRVEFLQRMDTLDYDEDDLVVATSSTKPMVTLAVAAATSRNISRAAVAFISEDEPSEFSASDSVSLMDASIPLVANDSTTDDDIVPVPVPAPVLKSSTPPSTRPPLSPSSYKIDPFPVAVDKILNDLEREEETLVYMGGSERSMDDNSGARREFDRLSCLTDKLPSPIKPPMKDTPCQSAPKASKLLDVPSLNKPSIDDKRDENDGVVVVPGAAIGTISESPSAAALQTIVGSSELPQKAGGVSSSENGSKSTDSTEQSLDSTASSGGLALSKSHNPNASAESKKALAPAVPPSVNSFLSDSDGSDFGANFFADTSSGEDENEDENHTISSGTLSHVSLVDADTYTDQEATSNAPEPPEEDGPDSDHVSSGDNRIPLVRQLSTDQNHDDLSASIAHEPNATSRFHLTKVTPGTPPLKSVTASPSVSSPSPTTSRTGLLNQEQNHKGHPAGPPAKALRMPNLSSTRQQKKNRKDYTEMQLPKVSPRNRFVKAFASPFRRSKRRGSPSNTLDSLNEDNMTALKATISERGKVERESITQMVDPQEQDETPPDAPIPFFAMKSPRSFDSDDAATQVSQLTFQLDDPAVRQNDQEGQWWWGVTAEGLEGWFPSSYVNQAVEAAEGFLSAKSIHDKVKSRPLDFDSDEESDEVDFPLAHLDAKESAPSKKSGSKPPKSPGGRPAPYNRKVSVESSEKAGSGSGSANAVAPTNSVSDKKQKLESKFAVLEETLKKQRKELGPQSAAVSTTLYELSILHVRNSNFLSSVECVVQALQIQKSNGEMVEAARSLHLLADIYSRQNQYKSALACLSEAQRLQETSLGCYHEEVGNTLNRIGNVLARQGEFDLAMENHKEALRIFKDCFGEDVKSPQVSQTLIQIGAVYYKERNSLATIQSKVDGYSTFIEGGMLEVIGRAHEERGSYKMALAFFEEKLQFLDESEESDDLDHVAETYNSLGMLSCRAGLYMEAIDYYDKALNIQIKLGYDDVQLAMARVLTGSVHYYLGHFLKALKLHQDALAILRDNVGNEHETVAATLFQIGLVRASLCQYDEAMNALHEALAIQKRLLGDQHPAALRTRREIGNMYAVYPSELPSAFAEFDAVLQVQRRIHGEKHPNVAETLHSVGCAQARKGDYEAALKTLEDCYNMRLEFLGLDHPLQATTLYEIAKIQVRRGHLKKAIHICDAALGIRTESLSDHHIDVAIAMSTKASCLVAKGAFVEANRLFLKALPMAEESVGSHPSVGTILVQMGVMHLRKCHFEEASEAIEKALDIYRKCNLDEDYPGIKEALADLEKVERAEMLCV
jgi:tetratricopeptide (TPR) repeat protein